MDATALGFCLAGVGAAGSIGALLLEPAPLGRGGLTFNSPGNAKPVRIRQAVRLVAALLVASGSVVVAVAQAPPWSGVTATAGGVFVAVWLHCAWSQRKLWIDKLGPLASVPKHALADQGLERHYRTAKRCASWSWALRHSFNGQTWPK